MTSIDLHALQTWRMFTARMIHGMEWVSLTLCLSFAWLFPLSAADSEERMVVDLAQPSMVAQSEQALSIHQAVSFLSKNTGNKAIVELGSSSGQERDKLIIEAGNWWDIAQQTSHHFGFVLKPAADIEGRHLTMSPEPKGYRLQGKAITEPVAFTKQPQDPMGQDSVQHIGPWRILAEPVEMAIQQSLNGTDRWMSLKFSVIGEPRLANFGNYHIDALLEDVHSEENESKTMGNAEPRLFATRQTHFHRRASIPGRARNTPQLYISNIQADDQQLHLIGTLSVVHLAEWKQEVSLSADAWHSIDLGKATLRLAIVSGADQTGPLRKELGLNEENQGYSAPNVLIALEPKDSLPRTSLEHILESLVITEHKNAFPRNPSRRINPRVWSEVNEVGQTIFLRRDIAGPTFPNVQPEAAQKATLLLQADAPQAIFSAPINMEVTVPHKVQP